MIGSTEKQTKKKIPLNANCHFRSNFSVIYKEVFSVVLLHGLQAWLDVQETSMPTSSPHYPVFPFSITTVPMCISSPKGYFLLNYPPLFLPSLDQLQAVFSHDFYIHLETHSSVIFLRQSSLSVIMLSLSIDLAFSAFLLRPNTES